MFLFMIRIIILYFFIGSNGIIIIILLIIIIFIFICLTILEYNLVTPVYSNLPLELCNYTLYVNPEIYFYPSVLRSFSSEICLKGGWAPKINKGIDDTNSDFLISISLEPNVVDLRYLNYVEPNKLSLKYQRITPSGCKDIWTRQFE